MAIIKTTKYPGRWESSPDYPMGKPKNRTTSTSKDGTYFEKDWLSDYEAFFGALMVNTGATANGTVDTANTSQFYDAMINAKLSLDVGQERKMFTSVIPSHLVDGNGAPISRAANSVLWAHAQTALFVSQSLKNANPEQYAMYYGDGDGSTTFTTPNLYLGHYLIGAPSGTTLGETQGDAMRNILATARFGANNVEQVRDTTGAFSSDTASTLSTNGSSGFTANSRLVFDASTVVPTAAKNRPMTGNIKVLIERGQAN